MGPSAAGNRPHVTQHSHTQRSEVPIYLLSAHHFSHVCDALLCSRMRRRGWLDLISPPSSPCLPECFPCDMEDVAFVRFTQTWGFHGFSWLSHLLRCCRRLLCLTEMTSVRCHHIYHGCTGYTRLIMEARRPVATMPRAFRSWHSARFRDEIHGSSRCSAGISLSIIPHTPEKCSSVFYLSCMPADAPAVSTCLNSGQGYALINAGAPGGSLTVS